MTTASFKPSTTGNPFELHSHLLSTPADEVAWLLQRRDGVGASECAAILGMGKWSGQTAYGVWLDKTGQVPLSTAMSEAMEWGHLLEPVIRDKAADVLECRVMTVGGLQSRERPWQRASLDAALLTPDDGFVPLEVKNTSVYLQSDWADDQVPDAAELQVQHQLAVCGAPYGYVAGLIGGNRLVVRRVDRDEELIGHICAEESVFWHDHVLARVTPPIVARDSIADIIAAAGTPDDDGPLILDPEDAAEARTWVQAYQCAAADEKRAKNKKAEARNNLAAIAAGYTEVCEVAGDVQHTLFKLQRGNFAARRFQDEKPDLAPLFMKKVEVVDTAALKNEDPTLFRAYQSLSVRVPKGGAA